MKLWLVISLMQTTMFSTAAFCVSVHRLEGWEVSLALNFGTCLLAWIIALLGRNARLW